MEVQQVANKLTDLCRDKKFQEAELELYAEDVVILEMKGHPMERAEGKAMAAQKTTNWLNSLETLHQFEVSDPIIAGNYFTVRMSFDMTKKGAPRFGFDELAVFGVKDGKISTVQFFYSR